MVSIEFLSGVFNIVAPTVSNVWEGHAMSWFWFL
jgi:hypothetical protein